MAELLPEVEEFIASRANPKARSTLEPLFAEDSRFEPSTGKYEKNEQAQREMLAGMQALDSEFQMQTQERMPYSADPVDPARTIFFELPDTRGSEFANQFRGRYVPPDETEKYDTLRYKDKFGNLRDYQYELVPDTVNIINPEDYSVATTAHEFRHRQGIGGGPIGETVNRVADVVASQTLGELKQELKDLNQYVFTTFRDFEGYKNFEKNRIEKVFENEDLSSKRPKNPRAIRNLIEEMFGQNYVPKAASTAPIPDFLQIYADLKQSDSARRIFPNKNFFDRSDFKESLLYKDIMGIKDFAEKGGLESLDEESGIINQELIERAKNVMMAPARVMQGASEKKAMGGPVGGLDVYFNQMRMM